jgi:predicted RNase H-like HicB family nuclease
MDKLGAMEKAIVEQDRDTFLYIGYVPGLPGAHSPGETLAELRVNLREVIEMLLENENDLFTNGLFTADFSSSLQEFSDK